MLVAAHQPDQFGKMRPRGIMTSPTIFWELSLVLSALGLETRRYAVHVLAPRSSAPKHPATKDCLASSPDSGANDVRVCAICVDSTRSTEFCLLQFATSPILGARSFNQSLALPNSPWLSSNPFTHQSSSYSSSPASISAVALRR